jgi:uncharacterized protein (DUF697 family)
MDTGQLITLICVAGCILPIVSLAIIGVVIFWFGRKWLDGLTAPDIQKMMTDYQAEITKNPQVNRQELVQKVINQQAFKCGAVGFITGLGGFFTLPIALPIDLVLSTQYQAAMVNFIAHLYGHPNDRDTQVATWMIMTGSGEVSKMSIKFIMGLVLRVIGKSFSKFVPFLGALVSFGVNYALAQSTGRLALRWYAAKQQRQIAN